MPDALGSIGIVVPGVVEQRESAYQHARHAHPIGRVEPQPRLEERLRVQVVQAGRSLEQGLRRDAERLRAEGVEAVLECGSHLACTRARNARSPVAARWRTTRSNARLTGEPVPG